MDRFSLPKWYFLPEGNRTSKPAPGGQLVQTTDRTVAVRGARLVLVDDNGPGIGAQYREEVFKPFHRLDPSRNPKTGGIGLGLTIARDITRNHGGDLVLEDSPLGGLRARLRLPL